MASKEVRVNAPERLMEEFKAWQVNHPNVRELMYQI